jgi:hypothetical protein
MGECVRAYVVSHLNASYKLGDRRDLLLPGEISQFAQDYGSPN